MTQDYPYETIAYGETRADKYDLHKDCIVYLDNRLTVNRENYAVDFSNGISLYPLPPALFGLFSSNCIGSARYSFQKKDDVK